MRSYSSGRVHHCDLSPLVATTDQARVHLVFLYAVSPIRLELTSCVACKALRIGLTSRSRRKASSLAALPYLDYEILIRKSQEGMNFRVVYSPAFQQAIYTMNESTPTSPQPSSQTNNAIPNLQTSPLSRNIRAPTPLTTTNLRRRAHRQAHARTRKKRSRSPIILTKIKINIRALGIGGTKIRLRTQGIPLRRTPASQHLSKRKRIEGRLEGISQVVDLNNDAFGPGRGGLQLPARVTRWTGALAGADAE